MLAFKYKAIDSNSKKISGIIQGEDKNSVASSLREQNLIILELEDGVIPKEDNEEKKSIKDINFDCLLEKITPIETKDTTSFLSQLASLTESGISVVRGLEILEEQTTNKAFKKTIRDIKKNVENGMSLSESMGRFPKIFNNMIVSIVKTGEETGLMHESLEQISTYLEEQSVLKKQVISSLIYPSIVIVVTIGVIIFMVLYVIPQLIPFIEMGGGEIAWSTQVLIDSTGFFQEHYKTMGTSILSVIIFIIVVSRFEKGKYYIDKIKIKIPLIGPILLYSSIIRFTKTLSILLNSGVSIVPGLESTSNVVNNEVIKEIILDMADSVLAGENLSTPMSRTKGVFPPIMKNIVKVGEETGNIHNSLTTLSEIFDKTFKDKIKFINTIMEPVLMVFIGGMVAFVVGALMSGILSSYGQF